MSHQKKIEQVLELLINEEHEAASELLHSVIVEKARDLYEELVDEDFGEADDADFADEIEADEEEVEGEEMFDGEEGEGEDDAEDAEEEEIEDRVEDLEAEFAELKAEFEAMVGDEVEDELPMDEVPMDDEMGELPVEDEPVEGMFEEEVDDLDEATKLQDEQKEDLKSEDDLAGAGGSEKAADKKSMFTNAPSKKDHGGKPHQTGVGGDESGSKAKQGKDHTPTSNIDVKKGKPSAKKEVGDDSSADSILGTKGTPTGK